MSETENRYEYDKGYAAYPDPLPRWYTPSFGKGWWKAHDDSFDAEDTGGIEEGYGDFYDAYAAQRRRPQPLSW